MKPNSIKERASSYKDGCVSDKGLRSEDIERAYERGAMDQQKISIDTACEWLLGDCGIKLMYEGTDEIDRDFVALFRSELEEILS